MTPEEASWRLGGELPLKLERGKAVYPAPLLDHALEIRTKAGGKIGIWRTTENFGSTWVKILGVPTYWWRNDDGTIEFYPTPNQSMEVYHVTSAD